MVLHVCFLTPQFANFVCFHCHFCSNSVYVIETIRKIGKMTLRDNNRRTKANNRECVQFSQELVEQMTELMKLTATVLKKLD